jgi:hypothetical protein
VFSSPTAITERNSDFAETAPMWRHPVIKLLLLGYIGWGGYDWFVNRSVEPPAGILAPGEPQQAALLDGETLHFGRWRLTARAHYELTARVLGNERYHLDALAPLIPEDLALGWGPMSDTRMLRSVEISQGNRFYFWRADGALPLPREAIIAHSANTHVIPANARIARQLSGLRRGEVVALSGDLVDAVRDDGLSIKTSLTRTDTGAGACEVMLVRSVAVLH